VASTFEESLVGRIKAAVAAAATASRRSELLRSASRARREGALMTVCAWCGSFAIGAEFFEPGDEPAFVAHGGPRVTHGICPSCLDDLKRTGKTR
jgi:hypothetical protein